MMPSLSGLCGAIVQRVPFLTTKAGTLVTVAATVVGCLAFAMRSLTRKTTPLMELANGIRGEAPPELVSRAERIAAKKAKAKVPPTQEEELAMLDTAATPRYAVDDPAWIAHLDTEGYAVVAGVADSGQLASAEGLLWDFLEQHTSWRRHDPDTWTDAALEKIGSVQNGLVNGDGMGQSDFLWYLRILPNVREVFARIWNTHDLLVSFDGAGIFRPWNHGFRKTVSGWWHVDQGRGKQGRHAVQGLVSLYDADCTTGGLTVVPTSHKRFDEVVEDQQNETIDYCTVQPYCQALQELPRRLVCCKAGDIILWDSRTIHANAPATETPTCKRGRLLRAVGYVCMTPAKFAPAEVRTGRRSAYEYRVSTSHWPQKLDLGSAGPEPPRSLSDSSYEIKRLVG